MLFLLSETVIFLNVISFLFPFLILKVASIKISSFGKVEFLYENSISFFKYLFTSPYLLIVLASISNSDISEPWAPAFIIKAPPTVPGTPMSDSKPL